VGREEPLTVYNARSRKRIDPALALLLPAFPLLLLIGHDQIWTLWIGRQLLGGADLYRDIIEVNPPLWFWMAVPQAAIGIPSRLVVSGFFAAVIALSLWLIPARYRLPSLAAFTLLPLLDFGQREHFSLIATAPYIFLIAARAKGEIVRHTLAIGLFAALGFALKPHFALVPIALELLIWSERRLRSETVAIAACAILYAAAVVLFAPEYLTETVPMLLEAYGQIQGPSILPFVLILFAVSGLALLRPSRTALILLCAALAYLLAMILQGKGWSYHSVPARGLLFLALAVELMRRPKLVQATLLTVAALLCLLPTGVYRNPFRDEIEQHLTGFPRGTSVYAVSDNPMVAWPMIEDRGFKWASRQMSVWQGVASREAARQVIAESMKRKPRLVVLHGPSDLVPLEGYRLHKRTERFVSYVRSASPSPLHARP
jgi:hypothetical protein